MIFIVYGTRFGQTAKIAEWMGGILRERGYEVVVADAAHLPRNLLVEQAEAIIIGASVIIGRPEASIRRFIRRHRSTLIQRPSAFFSVSGSAGSRDESLRSEARRKVDRFLASLDWQPTRVATIAGAMAYSRYAPPLRWMMRQIAKRTGASTDTSHDHEYTDWHQVAQFADSVASAVAAHRRTQVTAG
jgi:menaquinone-dependent protoporphyrinogen oxidase